MSDDLPDHERIRKLLNMTTSSNDGEVLNAIRMVNRTLTKNGWDWDRLLAGKIRIVADPWKGMAPPPPKQNFAANAAAATPPRRAPRPQSPPPPPPPPRVWLDKNGVAWSTERDRDLSNMRIDAAKRVPQPTIASTVSNKFADHCYCCGTYVNAGAGWIFHPNGTSGKWQVTCDPCNKSSAPIPARAAKRQTVSLSDVLKGI